MSLEGLFTAIGLGLMIGVVRERLHEEDGATIAGIRTHALVAVVTSVAAALGGAVLMIGLLLASVVFNIPFLVLSYVVLGILLLLLVLIVIPVLSLPLCSPRLCFVALPV